MLHMELQQSVLSVLTITCNMNVSMMFRCGIWRCIPVEEDALWEKL